MRLFNWFLKKRSRKRKIDAGGNHHNLSAIYSKVNAEYFGGSVQIPVSWFGASGRKPRTYFRFGYYNLRTQEVKIHRMLDNPLVPEYCVAFILYHEMLHHILPPIRERGGKRKIHHSAFTAREKEFKHYAEAKQFLNVQIVGKKLASQDASL